MRTTSREVDTYPLENVAHTKTLFRVHGIESRILGKEEARPVLLRDLNLTTIHLGPVLTDGTVRTGSNRNGKVIIMEESLQRIFIKERSVLEGRNSSSTAIIIVAAERLVALRCDRVCGRSVGIELDIVKDVRLELGGRCRHAFFCLLRNLRQWSVKSAETNLREHSHRQGRHL